MNKKNAMVKRLSLFLTLLLLGTIMLAGCQSQKEVDVDPAALADALKEAVTFQDEMTQTEEAVYARIYGTSADTIESARVYMSTGATAEEIAVFKAKTAEDAAAIYSLMEKRIENQKQAFEDYVPAEMAKLSDPVLKKEGKLVILCVSDENDKAQAKIDDMLKK